MTNLGIRENLTVKTIGISREYLSRLESIEFSEDFLKWVLPEIPRMTPPFSGQISILTLREHTQGSEIHAVGK